MPIVSIIVPNYNHSAFLPQRLESVFQQTFQDFEVILLDDASTDNSVEILRRYSNHSKVSHFQVNKINSGNAFKQWKNGISLAKGEFIWIAESDDFCELTFLEEIISRINDNHVLAYSATVNINEKAEVLGLNEWALGLDPARWLRDHENNGKEEIKNYLRYRNTIPNASAVIFRKESFQSIPFSVSMGFCGDWLFWTEILKKGSIIYVSRPLNYFRKHSSTTRVIKSFAQEQKRFGEYIKIIKRNSSFFSRIKNIQKYDWIFVEMNWKKGYFGRFFLFRLGLPPEFVFRYLFLRTIK